MNEITFEIFKVFALRFWMLSTRVFVLIVLLFAHYNQPNTLYIIAACISLPLVFIALYRIIETCQLYLNVRPNIDKIRKEIVKEEKKNYLKKVR